jgi:small-conductance mechanosensitive channel
MLNYACRMTGCINSTDDFITRHNMGIHRKKVICFLLSLTVAIALFGGSSASQEKNGEKSTPAETTKAVSPPSLSDLITAAAELDNRMSTLEKYLTEDFDATAAEKDFVQFNEKLAAFSDRLQNLKISKKYDYDQLAEVKGRLLTVSSSLQQIRAPVTERIEKIELWSKEWSEEVKMWKELQSSLAKDASVAALRPTFAKARNTIDKAQKLLASDLRPVLAVEQKAADIQAKIDGYLVEVEDYLRVLRRDILRKSAPSMFSTDYYRAFSRGLWRETKKGLEILSSPESQLFERKGLKLPLSVFLTLILIAFILRKRSSLAAESRLRFLAERPFSAGVLAGFATFSLLYGPSTGAWRVLVIIAYSICIIRVAGALIETVWRRRVVSVLIMLFVLHELLQFLALPLPLFRVYVFLIALIGLLLCGRGALRSPREGETRFYRWTLNLGVAVSGVILIAELSGYSGLATYLLEGALTTGFFVVGAGILMRLARGGLEWTFFNTSLIMIPYLRKHAHAIVSQAARLVYLFIGVFVFMILLADWGVYDSHNEAIQGVLSLGVTIGSFRLTVGSVLLAMLLLYGSLLVSRAVLSVLKDDVFPRRNLARGAQISMARLIHYGFVLVGFLFALAALGLDLTKVTIIGGALGVGIGFGLQQIVNNFICGIILLFERPISVGDYIELEGQWAEIKEIGLRATIVQNFDRADLVIPNSILVTNQVINWTRSDRLARIKLPVGVAYGSDVPLVMKILQDCAAGNESVAKSPEPRVIFMGFGDSSLDFELRVHIQDIDNWFVTRTELYKEIERKFRESGVEIPFPQRDLHLRSVDESPGSILTPPGDQRPDLVVVSRKEKDEEDEKDQ